MAYTITMMKGRCTPESRSTFAVNYERQVMKYMHLFNQIFITSVPIPSFYSNNNKFHLIPTGPRSMRFSRFRFASCQYCLDWRLNYRPIRFHRLLIPSKNKTLNSLYLYLVTFSGSLMTITKSISCLCSIQPAWVRFRYLYLLYVSRETLIYNELFRSR